MKEYLSSPTSRLMAGLAVTLAVVGLFSWYALEQIAGLKEEIAWATKEAREWRERCETMADEFNFLAHDAVSIGESYALSHAEKRGALKHWRERVWKFIQENRYPRNLVAKDSEIPF